MLAKCVNPSCSTPFRYLEDGRLFRLEKDLPVGMRNRKKSEYFWLCSPCSRTMTLRLDEQDRVAVAPLMKTVQSGAHQAEFVLLDRQRGLLLTRLEGALSFARAS